MISELQKFADGQGKIQSQVILVWVSEFDILNTIEIIIQRSLYIAIDDWKKRLGSFLSQWCFSIMFAQIERMAVRVG